MTKENKRNYNNKRISRNHEKAIPKAMQKMDIQPKGHFKQLE